MLLMLLSPSCYGLQKLSNFCQHFASPWGVKFYPAKSQLITFGGKTPMTTRCIRVVQLCHSCCLYLGTYICCKSGIWDISSNSWKYYSHFNNVLSVLGKYSHEMATLHLTKSYGLSALLYGCETWCLTSFYLHKPSVALNNSFRKNFSCCWKEIVKPLQYFCGQVPMSFLIHQRRLLFWQKMIVSDNIILATLSRFITRQFIAVGSCYGQ